jgi:acyl-CoA thioester hydrolase
MIPNSRACAKQAFFAELRGMSEHVVRLRPRYGEVDSMGVVYHAHYLVYFDVGRCEWLRAAGVPYAEVERRGFRLAVVDAGVRYLRPAHYDEELSVATRLEGVGAATVRFAYELRSGELRSGEPRGAAGLLATGHTRLGCLDTRNRPTRLPPEILAVLRRGISPPAPPSEKP